MTRTTAQAGEDVLGLEKKDVVARCSAGYRTMEHPKYRPAWKKAQQLDFNLVLEGGGYRGQFTSGVLDVFMDEGILAKTVIGVSAGALTGTCYAAGMRGRTNYLNTNYCDYWRYFSLKALLIKGDVFDVNFTFGRMLYETDPYDFDALAESPVTMITVASDLETGAADYHELRDLKAEMDYLRASASMPLVSRIVHVDGRKLLDGGIADSVPIEFSKGLGVKKQVVILTQAADYVKKANTSSIPRLFYRKYPKFVKAIAERHIGYNRTYKQLVEMHDSGEIFLIRPQEPVTLSSMDSDKRKLYALYLKGYEEGKRTLPMLKSYLDQTG